MRDGDVTRLETVKGNQANTVATINGIAATPRFSPDGKRIALLVTIGAKKEAGATQAGVRQIGEIGEHYDERRLAIFDVGASVAADAVKPLSRSEEHTSELQSLMRISYAVFCLKKKTILQLQLVQNQNPLRTTTIT